MSKHDKKCEVILWKNNLWNACWCHERALEAEVERLRNLLWRIYTEIPAMLTKDLFQKVKDAALAEPTTEKP